MAAVKTDHLHRTAAEPRDKSLNTVTLAEIIEINDQVRLFRLELSAPLRFLPGQWLDVYVPGVSKAGGYTITSPPSSARSSTSHDPSSPPSQPYLELAVQKSPDPPAAWLWQDPDSITYSELRVRVGGSFVWPPPGINTRTLRKVVFVAGGVGVNPFMSMLSSLAENVGSDDPLEVQFLYSLRHDEGQPRQARRLLFVERLASIFASGRVRGRLQLFLTGSTGERDEEGVISCGREEEGGYDVRFRRRRMIVEDVAAAAGDASERRLAVVYVCGVPTMADAFVQKLADPQHGFGMEPHRVLCEKWW
ncbi:uncharacterized protein GGS22DRAFT_76791 [Annulohypoxylon maeteangense]|uniref:uncharacterized protein n=1 Tax=Annulohypoxylon maeteangense TaxID=1927788 RepID=UPI002007D696|nr:uncharacterized protein GGS22DRAFT_76791 [Annulohypoxylon maeteangense]KAI0881177.1 hypothetical protein GGS22DRAFT_76791 [Annulohypoxylon maeteangense]